MKTKPRLLILFVLVLVAACVGPLGGTPRAQANGTPPFIDIGANLTAVDTGEAAWGDYNNDGKLDVLAVGLDGSGNPSANVYRNDGGGSFANIGADLTGIWAGRCAWGDYNNDGRLDILLTGIDASGSFVVKIYRNNGDGTFSEDATAEANLTARAWCDATWGDYNSDGNLDLVLTGAVEGVSGGLVTIYRNNGDGTFSENASADLLGIGDAAAWGDYNNDGRLDLLLAGGTGDWQGNGAFSVARVYRNNGDETFTDIGAGLPDSWGMSGAWGDYNSDGRLDILLTGQDMSLNYFARLYRNNGDDTFTEITNTGLTGVYANGIASWGDYNSDGRLDVVLTGATEAFTNPVTKVFRNNGDGTFTDIDAGLTGLLGPSSLDWGDYDSDGKLDILISGSDSEGNPVTKIYRNETVPAYTVEAFAPPIDNPPTINKAKAGQTIPVKWRLMDAVGVPVSDPASFVSVTSGSSTCSASDPIDGIESYSGNSGLQYRGDGWWQFNWKTPKAYAGQCRVMRLNLASGQPGPIAYFQFK